jgi:hypothetical protein
MSSSAPVLVPARPVAFATPPPEYIAGASDYLSSEQTWRNRTTALSGLRVRHARGPDGRLILFTPGLSADDPPTKTLLLRKPHGPHRARAQRFLASLVQHAGAISPEHDMVGLWSTYIDGRSGDKRPIFIRPFNLHELAAMTGVPYGQVNVLIRESKNAGYIHRRQRRKKEVDESGRVTKYVGERATLLLNTTFWRSCGPGIWRARRKFLGWKKRRAAGQPRPPSPPRRGATPEEAAAAERAWRAEEAAARERVRSSWATAPPPTEEG